MAALAAPAPAPAELFSFVSAPDSWNADVGDVRAAPGWNAGEPNSLDPFWTQATDSILAQLASHSPSFALVAGDLVNGHWDSDPDGVATFGATTSLAAKQQAVREAARTYYPQWGAQFARYGLRPRPAVGDHELGDNPWNDDDTRALVPTFREAWADAFTLRGGAYRYASHPPEGTEHATTAYAFRWGPVMVVTVDVFHQRPGGSVHAEVVGAQLRWLRRVLAAANADPRVRFVVVQGHTPALPPGRGRFSSRLTIEGGAASAFWRTLEQARVDLYLCGEFHAIGTASRGGVEQVVHGSIVGFSDVNYLSVRVFRDRMELALHRAPVGRLTDARLWQVGASRPVDQPWATRVVGRFSVAGRMTITAHGQERHRTGAFARRSRAGAPGT